MEKMHIVNSQIVISFDRQKDIRKKIFFYEDLLQNEFKVPFKTNAVPDDLDPNINRIETNSHNEFSRLSISQNRLTLATNFNDEYKNDFDKVEEYLKNKINEIEKIVKSEKINFFAFIIELGLFLNDDNINLFLKENTGANSLNNDTRDFTLFYSKEYKENFYININCSKFIEHEFVFEQDSLLIKPKNNSKNGISVIIDINSRLYFDKFKNFKDDFYEQLRSEVFGIIKNKNISDYLKGNV